MINHKNMNKLLSIVIISYNQEKYIQDSLLSALNQDYNNYEIIISDDCSTDNTWQIINEIVRNNTNTNSHNIMLNRNNENLGIVKNYQKALSLTTGEWIVGLAGDDIAKPNRLQVTNEILQQSPNDIFAIGTGFDVIDEKGRYISKNIYFKKNKISLPLFPGFASSIHRKTFSDFPAIKTNLQSEDILYTLRALELGKILLTNTSLVEHRIHSNNITSKGTTIEAYKGQIKNYENAIKTIEYYKASELRNKKLLPIIDNQINDFKSQIKSINFIISFYRMNIFKKFCNLHKIEPFSKRNKQYNIYFKIKVLIESYKVTGFLLKKLMLFLRKRRNTDKNIQIISFFNI